MAERRSKAALSRLALGVFCVASLAVILAFANQDAVASSANTTQEASSLAQAKASILKAFTIRASADAQQDADANGLRVLTIKACTSSTFTNPNGDNIPSTATGWTCVALAEYYGFQYDRYSLDLQKVDPNTGGDIALVTGQAFLWQGKWYLINNPHNNNDNVDEGSINAVPYYATAACDPSAYNDLPPGDPKECPYYGVQLGAIWGPAMTINGSQTPRSRASALAAVKKAYRQYIAADPPSGQDGHISWIFS